MLDKVEDLPDRRYAVIVDEAHSSQTGEAAKELQPGPRRRQAPRRRASGDLPADAVEEALAEAVAARGRQANLSFFAFTATPKGKTLELFGRLNPATGRHEPFHLYSMRQAIEEGFIHDVLANYTTYETYFRLEKALADDPRYETAQGPRGDRPVRTLHEHNLDAEGRDRRRALPRPRRRKIGGQAKAMVVCSSRLHAVRFCQALRRYVAEHGYDLGVLVAFSGAVDVNGGDPVTEAGMNGFPETQTAEQFDTDEYQILVVAEKFQTGFDQPQLYAMYVDKTLTGLAAVQTLSRLNRIHPDKDGTFVLDFVNDAERHPRRVRAVLRRDRRPAVRPEPALRHPPRPRRVRRAAHRRGRARSRACCSPSRPSTTAACTPRSAPAIDRFDDLDDDEQDRFRDALGRFVRTYSFLSQIVTFTDTDLERDYLFCKALAAFVKADPAARPSTSAAPSSSPTCATRSSSRARSRSTPTTARSSTIYSGTGRTNEPEPEPLSTIIERLNARYGTDWTDADRLVFDAAVEDLVADEDMQVDRGQQHCGELRRRCSPSSSRRRSLGRLDRNEKVVVQATSTTHDLAADVVKVYATLAQARAKVAYQEHCPIGELLGADGEDAHLEYKSTLRTGADTGEVYQAAGDRRRSRPSPAFANSRDGGTLLIGVADDGTVHGLASDYASLHKPGKDDRDLFLLHLNQLLINALGEAAASTVSAQIHTVDGAGPLPGARAAQRFPVDANVMVDKDGQLAEEDRVLRPHRQRHPRDHRPRRAPEVHRQPLGKRRDTSRGAVKLLHLLLTARRARLGRVHRYHPVRVCDAAKKNFF